MIEFSDMLYGKIFLPEWLDPFLRIPEFVRLRGVRLSNVDSFQFKDFNGPTRWEHCIAVASLAIRCARKRRISEKQLMHLTLAALFHDIATPPYAHTMEYVIEGFNHEIESWRILRSIPCENSHLDLPIYASQLPQFQNTCKKVSKKLKINIDPDEIARLIIGDGELGFLVNGTIDLDNADNVTRASLHLGIDIDKLVPLQVVDWLATQNSVPLNINEIKEEYIIKWNNYRKQLYYAFFNSSEQELGRQAFLQHLCRKALQVGIPSHQLTWNTDEGFLSLLENFKESESKNNISELRELVQHYRLFEPCVLLQEIGSRKKSLPILLSHF
ncbi:MAG: HD domain-containing protein [Candidatus Sumerlaeota bacterium]|nr:HD domain-containing protein [Candidatus Sumerlaeota bacterium]